MFPQQNSPTVSGKAKHNILKNILNASRNSEFYIILILDCCLFLYFKYIRNFQMREFELKQERIEKLELS